MTGPAPADKTAEILRMQDRVRDWVGRVPPLV